MFNLLEKIDLENFAMKVAFSFKSKDLIGLEQN